MVHRRTVLKMAAATTVLSGATSPVSRAVAAVPSDGSTSPATGGIDAENPGVPTPAGEPRVARGRRMAFLRFDPVPDSRVQRAKLRFTVTAQHGGEGGYWPFEVYGVNPHGWHPDMVTWEDSPRHGGDWLGLLDASSAADATPLGVHEIDVTGYVAERAAAGEPIAFRVDGLPQKHWTLALAGEDSADAPELVLFAQDPASDLGPAAPETVSTAGAGLWLRCAPLTGAARRAAQRHAQRLSVHPGGPVLQTAAEELRSALGVLLGTEVPIDDRAQPADGGILLGTADSPAVRDLLRETGRDGAVQELGSEGYLLLSLHREQGSTLLLTSTGEAGVLYGAFRLLRMVRLGEDLAEVDLADSPAVRYRLNHHWDNFPSTAARDGWGTIERGYAGHSPWQLDLPVSEVVDRYREYGRLNASVGINGTVLNNPNATTDWIDPANLPRIAALADALRPYGMRIHLALRFDSPMAMDGLDTADPMDPRVRRWWRRALDRVHRHVPDLGGVLVKGDSEGEPGPLEYGRSHAQAANMFAEILRPHGGVVLWRVFVYGEALHDPDPDRAKQAYELFQPQDGDFAENVILQSKHGPWDFQPREPVTPLFGGLPNTNLGIELALSKEYTGHTTHANYPVAYFERVFSFDTRARGHGHTVADVVDGSTFGYTRTLAVAVNNPGTDENWTRMPLDQSNWYGFGGLAWNPRASARDLATQWAQLALHTDRGAGAEVADWLITSDEVYRQYYQPLGIPFTSSVEYHFKNEPEAWEESANGATTEGIGVDRTRSGTGYSSLYPAPIARRYEDLAATPQDLVLFLHHVRYDAVLPHTRETLAQSIYDSTFAGVDGVRALMARWERLRGRVDEAVWRAVRWMLRRQLSEAINYRNVMNRYVRTRSGVADRRGRDDALRRMPAAAVPDQAVRPGEPVRGARARAAARAYLLPAAWPSTGRWEREDRLLLAADGRTGSRGTVRGDRTALRAPSAPGEYRLHAVNDQGFASAPSQGVVRVTDE